MRHHIIPKHEWRKRFGNLRGVNAPDNMADLSLDNHIQLHKRYGEEGSKNDDLAYRALSGQIGKEEVLKELARMNGRMMVRHTQETLKRMSDSHRGNTARRGHNTPEDIKKKISLATKGMQKTEEHKKKISLALKGRIITEETKRKMSLAHKG